MPSLILYLHGKGGSAREAERYAPLFPGDTVLGFDYASTVPWEAVREFPAYFDSVSAGFDRVILLANSLGAYFSLCALSEKRVDRAFFISPVVDMERLIRSMMLWAGVSEQELQRKGEIPTAFGETLSWEYLQWVRAHPVSWRIPTEILYGARDHLQPPDTVAAFAAATGAGLTVMEEGEHWFHTEKQLQFSDRWLLHSIQAPPRS